MNGEVTLRSTLLDCLKIKRQQLQMCSRSQNGLEPAKGMEETWDRHRREVKLLEKYIQSLEYEPVRKALADWQIDVMQNGPSAMETDGKTVI